MDRDPHLPQAEVNDLQRPVLRESDVVGLQVSVAHDAPRHRNVVEVFQSVAERQREVQHLSEASYTRFTPNKKKLAQLLI